jgi:hypothetical protein
MIFVHNELQCLFNEIYPATGNPGYLHSTIDWKCDKRAHSMLSLRKHRDPDHKTKLLIGKIITIPNTVMSHKVYI